MRMICICLLLVFRTTCTPVSLMIPSFSFFNTRLRTIATFHQVQIQYTWYVNTVFQIPSFNYFTSTGQCITSKMKNQPINIGWFSVIYHYNITSGADLEHYPIVNKFFAVQGREQQKSFFNLFHKVVCLIFSWIFFHWNSKPFL